MAAKKKMSVEEILASCRKADSDGGAGPEAAEAAADTAPAAAEKPQSASKQPDNGFA